MTLKWWDKMKLLIKDFCIDYSKSKNRDFFVERRKLQKLYVFSSDLNERQVIKQQLKILHEQNIEGTKIRSKVRNIVNNENMSMFYHEVEFKNNKK